METNCKVLSEDENKIVISIIGRIDSNNASQVDKSIHEIIQDKKDKALVLDFENLEYISSAGLRVLLKLQKEKAKPISILNVNQSIEEILEMTGFIDIFNVQKALRKCRIEGCRKIESGGNGDLYQLNDDTIIKVFHPEISLETVRREQQLSHKIFFTGLPTVISYDTVKIGDNQYGNIYELPGTETLYQVLLDYPAKFDRLMKKYIDLYKQIHSTTGEDLGLPIINDIYNNYIDQCSDWYSPEEMKKLHELVNSIPERNTIIHGDLDPQNIMVQDDELILLDLWDMSLGHPVFDFLTTAYSYNNNMKTETPLNKNTVVIPKSMIQKGLRMFSTEYFQQKTEAERNNIYKQVQQMSKLKAAVIPAISKGLSEKTIRDNVEDAKSNLLPNIDELIGSINW